MMKTTSTLSAASQRITVIDAMRGIALIGICLTHATQYFGARPFGLSIESPEWMQSFDGIVGWAIRYLVAGKFYMIFSFLFGLSFFIQMDRASQKGIDFRPRFLWRLTLLLLIGYLHSLIFHMDILIIYAIVGFPMVLMYKVPNKLLVGIAIFLLLGGVSLIGVACRQLEQPAVEQTQRQPSPRQERTIQQPDLSLGATLKNNSANRLLMKARFQHTSGRIYMTLGLFILGLLAGKLRFFHNLEKHRTAMYRWAAASLFSIALLYLLQSQLPRGTTNLWMEWLAMPVGNLINLLTAYVWVTVIVFFYHNPKVERLLAPVVCYGRMGLTNYIVQSVLGVIIYYRFGFGMNQYLTPFSGTVACLLYTSLQIWFSHWWLKGFRYGPLEWLWRSGTYTRWQPLRKAVVTA